MNAIHEVVLKNRLEQFRKRQRDDAEKAAAVHRPGRSGGQEDDAGADADVEPDDDDEEEEEEEEVNEDEDDFVEEYNPEMSPAPVEVGKMSLEDRRLPVIGEDDLLRSIVRSVFLHPECRTAIPHPMNTDHNSTPPVVP